MYDQATASLWSSLTGEPVLGPLVDQGIQLTRQPVVTTTWKRWRERHPETTVLSLETGYSRDYGEGVAYRQYFATDQLMFEVPLADTRLKNKEPVLALRDGDQQLAITSDFLSRHPLYQDQLANRELVILTDSSGAHRVYDSSDVRFQSWDGELQAVDNAGQVWVVSEQTLTRQSQSLLRVPAHRAFWFGWSAQYPETRLVK